MKRVLTIMVIVIIAITAATAPAAAKCVKGQQVKCPACINGKHVECPYWCDGRHMKPREIQDFEILEMGYSPEDLEAMTQEEKNQATPWFTVKGKRK